MRWLVIRVNKTMPSTATGRIGGVRVMIAEDKVKGQDGGWYFTRMKPLPHVPYAMRGGEPIFHSPDGFAIGYGGSGPTDLALAICAMFRAEHLHMAFRRQVIEPLDREKDVAIPFDHIEGILKRLGEGRVIV